ncbi:Fe(3+) ABC transporter substrate-binding protein [Tepidibacter formicigenes]|jgi:iron(III) transport system substrate-binding protein|uniref:Iron(III) transport system substrate-binding protein n=1 Tax=Tepidibacter formicigenes DSM 15518 TaxID=1123349 RepID=A0A1M6S9N5_9FIRM|nr:Fe(3+) ABC transporter substrate-binding protein [Tepidibacter formicigenes]SHK41391.1 iron(III) transport system substrate-binding protein [Tepidibacter formicigenes DSM 15518]
MKRKLILALLSLVFSVFLLVGCSSSDEEVAGNEEQVVNLYTSRHYDADKELYELFTKETGIKVNVVEGKSDELIERLAREGEDTESDILIVADAGRLHRAKEQNLLQSVESETLENNIPENLRDKDNQWYGLTVRGRVLVYSKDRVNPSDLSTYEDLTNPKWKGKILVRSSSNIYNQSLLASFIEINGEEEAKKWAKGLVENMAREPKGNDRDQAKAVVAGEGDIAIMNTYYIGKLLNSSDPEEVKVGKQVGVFFPNQDTTGTHINVSGAGVTKYAKNKENAIKFIEFLSSEKAQKLFAQANYEYPVNKNVEPSDLLKSWGEFKTQNISLNKLGENNKRAVEIFNEVGWK